MKRIAFMIVSVFMLNAVLAQTNTPIPDYGEGKLLNTPGSLTQHFNSDFPNNNPTWTSEGAFFRADFTDPADHTDRYVTYDTTGTVVHRGTNLPPEEYPESISTYYTKKYPNESYHVWTREDKSGNKTYYVNRNTEVLWFDKNGNYTSTVTSKTKNQPTKKSK